jgi:hypothetical protein
MARLLESDFLTVDLSRITKSSPAESGNTTDSTAKDTTKNSNSNGKKQASTKKIPMKDWGAELELRLKQHKAKDPNRPTDKGKLLLQFWTDFYTANWNSKIANKLLQIDLLRQDIEENGFDPLINPFLAFLIRPFAKKMVLEDLLNAETFKGIYNAVAHEYLADSEFVQENSYNILYCVDLYKQTPTDIEEYLRCQSAILKPSAPKYSEKTRAKNIQIFLVNGSTSVRDSNAKLNELDDIKELIKTSTGKSVGTATGEDNVDSRSVKRDFEKVVKGLKTKEHLLAALQYIYMSTQSEAAAHALSKSDFSKVNITGEALIKATSFVAKQLKGTTLTKNTADDFVELLLRRLN